MNDPVSQVYQEMIKYDFENTSANNVLDLRVKYSLPLNEGTFVYFPKEYGNLWLKNKLKPMHFLN